MYKYLMRSTTVLTILTLLAGLAMPVKQVYQLNMHPTECIKNNTYLPTKTVDNPFNEK